MAAAISLDSPLAPPLPIHRFSVAQYHQLGELGVLTPEDNVELLEGWIVQKMNQRPLHGFVVRLLADWFARELPAGWLCQCQLPITTERSEPEPDIAIIRGSHQEFRDRHPSGTDCRLVIEVADTSVQKDRAKATIYRDAGIPEYWIVNLADRQLDRYVFDNESHLPEPQIVLSGDRLELSVGDSLLTVPVQQMLE